MRLLKILPASDTEPDNLRAEVILCLRKEAPPYKPLSYTWGQQDASCSIWLRDTEDSVWKPFSIRPNLESCLKQLREEVQEAQVLWVDATCINQLNNVEKGHQVGTIDLVYRSQRLIIWLGDSSDNSDLAIDLGPLMLSMQNGQGIVARFLENQTDETWAALIDLIKRPWFTRRWV
ncbi:heterokaryon incompatibility, partial [Colletotrichum acutatum]